MGAGHHPHPQRVLSGCVLLVLPTGSPISALNDTSWIEQEEMALVKSMGHLEDREIPGDSALGESETSSLGGWRGKSAEHGSRISKRGSEQNPSSITSATAASCRFRCPGVCLWEKVGDTPHPSCPSAGRLLGFCV